MKLSKKTLRELKKEYLKLKEETEAVWNKYYDLKKRMEAVETIIGGPSDQASGRTSGVIGSTLRQAITTILKEEGKPIKASEIRVKLKERDIKFKLPYFWRIVGRMEGRRIIKRVGLGTYQLISGDADQGK